MSLVITYPEHYFYNNWFVDFLDIDKDEDIDTPDPENRRRNRRLRKIKEDIRKVN
jgi:hypothetical protein